MFGILAYTLALAVGVAMLVKGADLLVDGGGKTAAYVGVPTIVIGLTLVSFGTSLPELAASLNAISKGRSGISVGNVIGSNVANMLLVLGASALISPIDVERKIIKREIPIMFAAISLFLFVSTGSIIYRWEGVLLLIGFIAYLAFFTWVAITSDERIAIQEEIKDEDYVEVRDYDVKKNIGKILLGLGGIVLGAELMIRAAVFYISHFGLSEGVVGLSIIALATSLPELAASSVAAYKKESDISLGNVIGSNTFNILMVLGICAVFFPLNFSPEIFPNLLIMTLVSILLTVFLYTGKKLSRLEGGLMLAGYFVYIYALYFWI